MRAVTGIVAALALAACSQQTPTPTDASKEPAQATPAAASNGCPAHASAHWSGYAVEATTVGATCAEANAALVMRDPADGRELYREEFHAAQNFSLREAATPQEMERVLREWITPPGAARNSTGDLPEWPAGADGPRGEMEEFPFYVEQGIDRDAYEALRRSDLPMFCFVQGIESEGCVWLENGVVTKIGAQSFPG